MKLYKNYILVEQVMTKKDSAIIIPDKADDSDQFEITQKIIGKGPDCTFVEVGDIPIIAPHFQEYGRQLVEGSKEEGRLVFNVIFNEDDVVGADDEPQEKQEV